MFTDQKIKKKMKKDEVVIIWKGNKLPCEDCKVVFKNRFGKEYTV